jgi:fatty acid desaturase
MLVMKEDACDTATSAFDYIARETVKQLSRRNVWRAVRIIVLQWLIVIASITLAVWAHSVIVAVGAVTIVASRQHALLVLMHDGAHGLLARQPVVNDALSNVVLAFPLFVSTSRYRKHHLRHHRHLNTAEDPDLADSRIPSTDIRFLILLLQDLTFLTMIKSLRSWDRFGAFGAFLSRSGSSAQERRLFAIFLVFLVVGLTVLHWWVIFAVFWLYPTLAILPVFLRIRSASEHSGRLQGPLLRQARSIDTGIAARVILAPCNVNRHLEHHLFPSVPCFNLERLATLLRANSLFTSGAKITLGYVFGEDSLRAELFHNASRASGRP